MIFNSLLEKAKQLEMSIGSARYNLNKSIMFHLASKIGMDICYRCNEKIVLIDEFSIDHKVNWLKSSNPIHYFFDFSNIAFSHLECNISHSSYSKRNEGLNKNTILGMNFSTASHHLRKNILFNLSILSHNDKCFRCSNKIKYVNEFSVEHKIPWLHSENPRKLYFDLNNIAFSHHGCNIIHTRRQSIVYGGIKYKGVTLQKDRKNKKFRSVIVVNGERIHLGYFDTPKEAAFKYDEIAKKILGNDAITNCDLGLLPNRHSCEHCNKQISKFSKSGLCNPCSNRKNSKVHNRPSRTELIQLILEKPFTQIGLDFGVSDNAVRKWCKIENLPYRKADILNLKDDLLNLIS